jgi:hypothetical protein
MHAPGREIGAMDRGRTLAVPRLSRPPFLLVSLTLALIVLLLLWAFQQRTITDLMLIEYEIPGYEQAYGFTAGWMKVPLPAGEAWDAYGIVDLDPRGKLAGLGFRAGDIPVAHHGDGLAWFCWALKQADAGKEADLWVANVHAHPDSPDRRRKIIIKARQ